MAQQVNGYLADKPENPLGAILVLHAWWGLNDTIRTLCDRLAQAGFVAYAPDLYNGEVTDQIEEAEKLAGKLDGEQATAKVLTSVEWLQLQSGNTNQPIAVIGFSLGAYFALALSSQLPEIVESVVIFYGTGDADFSQSRADYIGHFADNDPYEPLEFVQSMETDLRSAGRNATFYHYPDTGHWFFESDRTDAYNPAAAKLAWERTLDFLKRERSS